MRGINQGPVNSPHKWPVTQKNAPFDDVIMVIPDSFTSNRIVCKRIFWRSHPISELYHVWYHIEVSVCIGYNSKFSQPIFGNDSPTTLLDFAQTGRNGNFMPICSCPGDVNISHVLWELILLALLFASDFDWNIFFYPWPIFSEPVDYHALLASYINDALYVNV